MPTSSFPSALTRTARSFGVAARAAALLIVAALPARAQRLAGVVRDGAAAAPLAGAVVSVMDTLRRPLASSITDEAGRYSLNRAPGGTSLRVVRIGYQPRTIAIAKGDIANLDVEMSRLATLLSSTLVNDARICSTDQDRTAALSLWEQARAGLLASVVARETQPATAMVLTYERVTDSLGHMLKQTGVLATGSTTRAFVAGGAPAQLAERGYLLSDADGRRFAAPDADVLLDDTFAATHCFGVVSGDSSHRGAIGLSFQPARGRDKLVDVRGVLWMSAGTPALESIEYRYTGGEPVWERMGASGTIHFTTMPNGVVFVDRWKVGLPVLVGPNLSRVNLGPTFRRIGGSLVFRSATVNQVSETGGVVLSQTWPNDLHYDSSLEPFAGTVVEQGSHWPVVGALVVLGATGDTLVTDSAGHFSLHPALAGHYSMALVDTSLASFLPPRSSTRELVLADGKRDELTFEVPSRAAAARAPCAGTNLREGTSVLLGRIADLGPGRKLPGQVSVEGAWRKTDGGTQLETETVGVDEAGRFSICGVPRDRGTTLTVRRGSTEFADTTVSVSADAPFGVMEWRIDVAALASAVPPRLAVLRGRVLREGANTPVAGADVWLPTHDRRATTDSSGAFRFDNLKPGIALLQVRSIGYLSRRDSLTVAAGGDIRRDIALSSRETMLDTVRTTATSLRRLSPGLRGFEQRRARKEMGGYFISDSILRKNEGRTLASVILAHANGVALRPSRGSGYQLVSSRKACSGPVFSACGSPNCFVTIYLDGALMFSPNMGTPAPDASQIELSELSGVEFYPSTGSGPIEYNSTGNGCGTLLLWSREQ